MRTRVLTPLCLAIVMSAAGAEAQTYFVALHGSDSDPGTSSRPFRTINKGVSVLTPGATLYVNSGTYAESLQSRLNTIRSGTSWSAPVTIAANPGARVVLRPNSGDNVIGLNSPSNRYIVFDGLILDAINTAFTDTNWGTGVYLGDGASHIRLKNVEILNAPGQGILTTGTGSGFHEFLNLFVHDNGRVEHLTHGVYLSSSNNLVEGCFIYNNAGWGLQVYTSDGSIRANDNVIRANQVFNNNRLGGGGGIDISSGDRNSVYNNVIWGNAAVAITVAWGNPTNTKILNNTIFDLHGIQINYDSSAAVVRNNIVYGSSATIDNRGAGTTVSNNLLTDPRFVNPAANDFRLRPGSPAIDAGAAVAEVPIDLNRVPRPQLKAFDIGAYEYGAPPPLPPTNLRSLQQ